MEAETHVLIYLNPPPTPSPLPLSTSPPLNSRRVLLKQHFFPKSLQNFDYIAATALRNMQLSARGSLSYSFYCHIVAYTNHAEILRHCPFVAKSLLVRWLRNTCGRTLHCKKRLRIFPSTAGMLLTKISLAWNNLFIPGRGSLVSDIPSRESLVSDIPAGTGKSRTFCYSVMLSNSSASTSTD